MNSTDLAKSQLRKLSKFIDYHHRFYVLLLRRMDARGFPDQDDLRRTAQRCVSEIRSMQTYITMLHRKLNGEFKTPHSYERRAAGRNADVPIDTIPDDPNAPPY